MTLQRWRWDYHPGRGSTMLPDPNGPWVKHLDVIASQIKHEVPELQSVPSSANTEYRTHDPLCPFDPDETCYNCGFPGCYCAECQCALIARVRLDERGKGDLGLIEWGAERGYDDGYAAALSDAVEAVRSAWDEYAPLCECTAEPCAGCLVWAKAVAAIVAVGGKR